MSFKKIKDQLALNLGKNYQKKLLPKQLIMTLLQLIILIVYQKIIFQKKN